MMTALSILLTDVHPHPQQPRHDLALTRAFVNSVQEHGIVIPVILHFNGSGYVTQDGHRRIAAARQIGRDLLEPHEYVLRQATDETSLTIRLANAHRRNLNPLEWAAIFAVDDSKGSTHSQIAAIYGVSRMKVSQYLKLDRSLNPDTRQAVLDGHLKFAHARQLGRLSDGDDPDRDASLRVRQSEILQRLADEGWKVTTRRLEAWVTATLFPNREVRDQRRSVLSLPKGCAPTAPPHLHTPIPPMPSVAALSPAPEDPDNSLILREAQAALDHVIQAGKLIESVLSYDSFDNALSRQVSDRLDALQAEARRIVEVLK